MFGAAPVPPATARVPSARTSLTPHAPAPDDFVGSSYIPTDSDQNHANPPEVDEPRPTTSPALLMSLGQIWSPPSTPSSRVSPEAYQIMPRSHPAASAHGALT